MGYAHRLSKLDERDAIGGEMMLPKPISEATLKEAYVKLEGKTIQWVIDNMEYLDREGVDKLEPDK